MNVGFYYHVEAAFDDGTVRVPGLLGMFITELARNAGQVTFYAHSGATTGIEDFVLDPALVRCVDLGPRRSFPERLLRPARSLQRFTPDDDRVDVMLVRGPSPLLPHIAGAIGAIPLALHIVGDYADQRRSAGERTMPLWRYAAIRSSFRLYAGMQRRAARRALVLVNTPDLAGRFAAADVVFESTLTEAMLAPAPRTDVSRPARLVYTGRILPEKGLWEAVEAVGILAGRGHESTLDIVGWEDPSDPVVDRLRAHVHELGLDAQIRFVGYVPAGDALAKVYADADLFVLPTHGEGFPRSLFEAMGCGLPSVTTAVGGIPHWISHEREALLVPPRSASALADAIQRLLVDDELRRRVAHNGWAFARAWTVEKGCALLAAKLADHVAAGTRVTS